MKKNHYSWISAAKLLWRSKVLKTMRLTLFAILVSVAQIFATNAHAQQTRLSLNLKNTSIRNVLGQIENQTDFYFIYNAKAVDVQKAVTIEVENESIPEILDRIFEGSNVTYKIDRRQIAISTNLAENAVQQEVTVSGRVTDSSGVGLPGVTVVLKGTTQGTITDANGNYSLANVSTDATLVFSFVGMKTREIPVSGKESTNVVMEEETVGLDEVVAIGYAVVKKSDLTGSVTQVNSKELTKLPAANLGQALQGNVPGLWTNQSDRSPGAGVHISLRGSNSFLGNDPLYIVDGFPIASGGGINAISPNDIESISILKDASSTAIYGARAANGVILITTKSGKKGKTNIDVNVYRGFKSFANKIEMVSGPELATLRREAYQNDNVNGGVAIFRDEETTMINSGKQTDWLSEITGSGRQTENYQLTFSKGDENSKLLVSGNLYNEKGVVNNSDFIRGSIRVNMMQQLKKFTFSSNSNIALMSGMGVSGPSVLYPATIGNPLAPVKQDNGDYYVMLVGVGNTPWANPKAYTEMIKSRYMEPQLTSSMALEYLVVDGLKIKTQLSGEIDLWKENYYVPIQLSSNHEESGRVADGFARVTNTVNYNWMSETYISYTKAFDTKHKFDALGGVSVQKNRFEYLQSSASGFPVDLYETYNLGVSIGSARKPSSDLQEWSMMSYFGRLNYTFKNKYFITGNFRADGSSRFGANNKWGFFPSSAVAWKMSEEDFIKNLGIFSDLKLRLSYGLAGNANALGIYSTQARLSSASYNWGGVEAPGYYVSQLSYENLKWETTKQLNVGLDFGLFENRITATADYYLKNTYDLLRSLPILAVSGFQSGWANMGELKNQGLELSISGRVIEKELKWNTTLNLAGNRNELTSLGDGTTQIGTEHWVGKPIGIGSRYMIEKIGIWQVDEAGEATKYGAVPGDVKYNDLNNDYKIDGKDRDFHGNLTPTFYGSWTNNFTYKGFDLNTFITFETGRDVYNGLNYKLLAGDGFDNHRKEITERWTPQNPTNKYPRAAIGNSNRSSMSSTEFLEDASFVKLKSVTLGYTLPNLLVKKAGCEALRIYLSGTNLLTLTEFSGVDPEDGDYGNTSRYAPYPITRTFTIGIEAKF